MPNFGTKHDLLACFWPKMVDLDTFGLEFENVYCYIWNQHSRICLIAKAHEKVEMHSFGTKNVLFGYFWARISKNCCHIWNQHSQIYLTAKFCEKTKMPKFGTKSALFGYFSAIIFKSYCNFRKKLLQKIQKVLISELYSENFYMELFCGSSKKLKGWFY